MRKKELALRDKKIWKKISNLLSREGAGGKNSALAPGGSTVPTEGVSVLEDEPISHNRYKISIFAEIVCCLGV